MADVERMTDEERAKLFPIILSEYNPAWPQWYTEEKERLLGFIGTENVIRVTHIGSTAVTGLIAKPTVDILLEIAETTDVEKLAASLPEDEYVCLRQQTIPTLDLVMFLKGYTTAGFAERVYHIHVRYPGDWDEPRFCDYLIAYPETAGAYAVLKRKLKERFEFDRDGYTNAKGEFIKAVIAERDGKIVSAAWTRIIPRDAGRQERLPICFRHYIWQQGCRQHRRVPP